MDAVYVIDFGDQVKIGITKNIKSRIKQLQFICKRKAKRYFFLPGDFLLEQIAHRKFSAYKIQGEYYHCPFEEVCEFLAEMSGNKFLNENILIPGENDDISTKIGRPIVGQEPKDRQIALRATETTVAKFSECAKISGKTKTDLLEEMVNELYNRLTKK